MSWMLKHKIIFIMHITQLCCGNTTLGVWRRGTTRRSCCARISKEYPALEVCTALYSFLGLGWVLPAWRGSPLAAGGCQGSDARHRGEAAWASPPRAHSFPFMRAAVAVLRGLAVASIGSWCAPEVTCEFESCQKQAPCGAAHLSCFLWVYRLMGVLLYVMVIFLHRFDVFMRLIGIRVCL